MTWLVIAVNTQRDDASANESAPFCAGAVLHDYEARLNTFPPMPSPSRDERLPLEPRGTTLRRLIFPLTESRLAIDSGSAGYTIDNQSSAPIDWNVEAAISTVNADGLPLERVSALAEHVKGLQTTALVQFILARPAKIGYYRYDMTIVDGTGNRVGYGFYFRTVRGNLAARLGARRATVKAGSTFYVRAENRGTIEIAYSQRYKIERKIGRSWREIVSGPNGRGFPRRIPVRAGYARSCMRVGIPKELEAGSYRLTKWFERGDPSENRPLFTRTARFTVVDG